MEIFQCIHLFSSKKKTKKVIQNIYMSENKHQFKMNLLFISSVNINENINRISFIQGNGSLVYLKARAFYDNKRNCNITFVLFILTEKQYNLSFNGYDYIEQPRTIPEHEIQEASVTLYKKINIVKINYKNSEYPSPIYPFCPYWFFITNKKGYSKYLYV